MLFHFSIRKSHVETLLVDDQSSVNAIGCLRWDICADILDIFQPLPSTLPPRRRSAKISRRKLNMFGVFKGWDF